MPILTAQFKRWYMGQSPKPHRYFDLLSMYCFRSRAVDNLTFLLLFSRFLLFSLLLYQIRQLPLLLLRPSRFSLHTLLLTSHPVHQNGAGYRHALDMRRHASSPRLQRRDNIERKRWRNADPLIRRSPSLFLREIFGGPNTCRDRF